MFLARCVFSCGKYAEAYEVHEQEMFTKIVSVSDL